MDEFGGMSGSDRQIEFDNTMDVRRLLRSRGEEPGDTPPVCDVCMTWVATHVIGTFLVCDKPRCQDKAEAAVIEQTFAFEAWELPHCRVEFTLRTVGGDVYRNLSEREAKDLVARLLQAHPAWEYGQPAQERSMTE